jgi:hypothetical protein
MDKDADPPEIARPRDTRSLWRFVGWGTLAAMALAGVVLTTQTEVGAKRLQLAFAPLTGRLTRAVAQADLPPNAAATPLALASNGSAGDSAKETEALRLETLRLRAEVRALAADRDRLNTRVAGLENNLNDMTGSIKRELALVAAPTSPPPIIERPQTAPPRADTATAGDDGTKPADLGGKQDKSQARFESHVDTATRSATGNEAKSATKPETRAGLSAKPPATPATIETVPLPPVRVASAPTGAQPGKPEIGIELGGARKIDILNARWIAVKANFGPYIEGMHPLMVHDPRPGINIPYKLIIGPLPNGAAAAQLCQRFAASKVTCRTTHFAGEPFSQP